MSDYQNLDLRSPESRRASGMSFRGILIMLAVVFGLFALLASFGGSDDDDAAVPPAANEQTAPAATAPEAAAPAATAPAAD